MRYLLAVAEHGHFGRAAEALGIKQPPLSQQIQSLEAELGVQLLVRSRHGSQLTAAGETFAVHARAALEAADAARRESQRVHRGESGRLIIGFLPSAFDTLLPKIFTTFARQWPQVTLQPIEFPLTTEAIAALRRGAIDWAIARPPLASAGVQDDLRALPLLQDQVNVVLPRSHALARRTELEPGALRADSFLITPLEERFPGYFQMICQAAGFEPTVAGRVKGAHTLVGMVAANLGVGLLPQSARAFATAGVVFTPLTPSVVAPPLTLIWRSSDNGALSRRFLVVVREVLQLDEDAVGGQDLNRGYLSLLRRQVSRIERR